MWSNYGFRLAGLVSGVFMDTNKALAQT